MANFVFVILCAVIVRASCAPQLKNEKFLEKILDGYDENLERNEVKREADYGENYDVMQGDQPMEEVTVPVPLSNYSQNISDLLKDLRTRTKDNWVEMLKENILRQIGRSNVSLPIVLTPHQVNMTKIQPSVPKQNNFEDFITKKIMSFNPSCQASSDPELKVEEKSMSLFFNYSDERSQISMATLRLHRLQPSNTSHKFYKPETFIPAPNEKLYRVTIYWYRKESRTKRHVEKLISDSKVISEYTQWVDLIITNAVRTWSKDQNLGLVVQVENERGDLLKTEEFFKGPICRVGTTTPKPIPNYLVDAAKSPEELFKFLGRNKSSPESREQLLVPTMDVCSVGYPMSDSAEMNFKNNPLPLNACTFKHMQEQAKRLLQNDQLDQLVALAELRMTPPPELEPLRRHIRHQHMNKPHNLKPGEKKVLMTRDEVFRFIENYNKSQET